MLQLFTYAFDYLGFGAKTAVGYGAVRISSEGARKADQAARKQALKCQWVEDATLRLSAVAGVQNPLFSQQLAQEWNAIQDPILKEIALQDIRASWGDAWEQTLEGARKEARAMYEVKE